MNFRKIASNKHVDMRKIENFVRSKGKTAAFRKPCKNFKIVDEILTYKEKRWVIFDNDRKTLNLGTTLFYRQFSTHLRHLNCKESKPFRESLGSTYFPKEYLLSRKKTSPRNIYFLWNYDWRVAYNYGDTGAIFKQKGPSCKKKELHVNSTSNTFHRKYENFD